MNRDPSPKKPRKKDAEYMRKAYTYSAILLILGIIGAFILGNYIAAAEEQRQQDLAEHYHQQSEEQADEEQQDDGSEPPPLHHE